MNKVIRLSICIPTRNQPKRLEATIASILEQLNPEIEVLISDDSDSIDVNYSNPSIPIAHIKGAQKGVDPAIFQLASIAKGEFIWFLGDDLILEGGVWKVLNMISKNPPIDFYWLNAVRRDEHVPTTELSLEVYKNKDCFITKLGDQLGFLSCLLIRKSTILLEMEEDKKYFGTQWISIYFALKSISNSTYLGLVRTPLVGTEKRYGPSHWYDVMQVFGINLPKIYKHFIHTKTFSTNAINKIIRSNLISLIKTIFVGKATNSNLQYWKDKKYILLLFKEHKKIFTYYGLLPILLLPNPICKILYFAIKKSGYKTPIRFKI
jgi:glycosyltransferase involved in cell wall biosynthesis